jgi:hypothetical protein
VKDTEMINLKDLYARIKGPVAPRKEIQSAPEPRALEARPPQKKVHIRTPDGVTWELWMRSGDVAFPVQSGDRWTITVRRV